MEKRLTWSNPELLRFDNIAHGLCISGSSDAIVCIGGSIAGGCATGTDATFQGCIGGSAANIACGGGGSATYKGGAG